MNIQDSGHLSIGTMAAMRAVAEKYILPRFKKLAEGDVRSKTHPGDLVTIADTESEHALTDMLPKLLPGSLVIGEEAASADAGVLRHLAGEDPVWIIDPVDGTANFVNGVACFAVMVALVRHGETLAGWIHDPVANRTLWAEKGRGAWLAEGGAAAVKVQVPRPQRDALSAMTAGLYNRDLAALKGKFARIVRLGSAAHDYWSLSDGRMQVLAFRRLKPWDHAAGVLIHTEAGGYNKMLSGQDYSPAAQDQVGILCTPTKGIWQSIVAAAALEAKP
ncbi:MAG: inositol monophosphatase [Rhodospirillaceae bacterium]|nr:inositol monophosphatase [Rhodospirillaceae bacterium]